MLCSVEEQPVGLAAMEPTTGSRGFSYKVFIGLCTVVPNCVVASTSDSMQVPSYSPTSFVAVEAM